MKKKNLRTETIKVRCTVETKQLLTKIGQDKRVPQSIRLGSQADIIELALSFYYQSFI